MNSQKGYVVIIDTSGDVTDTVDDEKGQPWLSAGGNGAHLKGLLFGKEPEVKLAPGARAKSNPRELLGWQMSEIIFP